MLTTIPLLKVDAERRLVVARAAAMEPDRSGEIMDWDTAKPEFLRWSNSFAEATGGMSKGNVRLQHDPKRIAGKVIEMEFDEPNKAVNVVCKVVDDAAWKLCLEGCVTGISIGGSYGAKWKDPATGLTKYTPKITEISLVDNPCIPSARIVELVKADGAVEELRLTGRPRSFVEVMRESPRSFAEHLKKVQAETPRSFREIMEKRQLSEAELRQRREAAKSRGDGSTASMAGAAAGAGLGLRARRKVAAVIDRGRDKLAQEAGRHEFDYLNAARQEPRILSEMRDHAYKRNLATRDHAALTRLRGPAKAAAVLIPAAVGAGVAGGVYRAATRKREDGT